MRFDVLTIFPGMFSAYLEEGMLARAVKGGLVDVRLVNIRDFATGTHKAIIFCWLQHEGRGDEKTATYGYTRSWSKIGSAVSVVVAAGIVMTDGRYAACSTDRNAVHCRGA